MTANVYSIYVKQLCTMRLCFSVCSVRPVLSVLLILSSNQCLIISFTSRAFNARIAYCCTDNRFVCLNVKFDKILGKSLSGTLFPMNVHTQNYFSLSKIVGKYIKKWKFPRNSSLICDLFSKYLIRNVIVSPFPTIFNAPIPFPKADKMIYMAVAHRSDL